MRIAQVAPLYEPVLPRLSASSATPWMIWVEAVKRIDIIERAECRRHVEQRFRSAEWLTITRRYRRAVRRRLAPCSFTDNAGGLTAARLEQVWTKTTRRAV